MALTHKVVVSSIVLISLVISTVARPGNFQEFGLQPHEDRCKGDYADLQIVEVCQRCAKQTKSGIVYPMCCKGEDDAFNWCESYINFGKKSF